MRYRYIFVLLVIVVFNLFSWYGAKAQGGEPLVELSGQVFFEDSDEPVSGLTVRIEGTNRYTTTNDNGNFTIVVTTGDRVIFSGEGLFNAYYQLPAEHTGTYKVIKQFVAANARELQEYIVKNYMTPEEFDFIMKYGYVPDEQLLAMRNNMNENKLMSFLANSPMAAMENPLMIQQTLQGSHGTNYGQPANFGGISFNKWNDFFRAWKNGDFRKK